jgi:ABC-type uncharacterized transport system ATPase subunit
MAKASIRRPAVPAPRANAHHTIVGLEVTGGFLAGLKLEFVDGLNCVIGGRGTGKTTVLEFIRYTLGAMPDPKTNPARSRALGGLIQSNLGNGRVRLRVRTKHGVAYTAERPWNDTAQVLDEKGVATTIALDRDLIFRADVYSQNEIEEIATTPSLQLALIDKFVEEQIRRVNGEARKLRQELDDNAVELIRLERETRELEETATEVAALEEKLKALEESGGPDAKKINAAHAQKTLRDKERRTLELLRTDMQKIASALEAAGSAATRQLEGRMDEDVLEGPNKKIFAKVSDDVRDLSALIDQAVSKLRKQAQATAVELAKQAKALSEIHARQELDYRNVVAQSDDARDRAAERAQIQQRYVEVTTKKMELEVRQKERLQREQRRRELAGKLSAVRDERFDLRRQVAERLSRELEPHVRVSVAQAGARDLYRDLLSESLKGAGMRQGPIVDKILQNASPEELAALVRRGDPARLGERAGIDQEKARRVIETLRNPELLYAIETVELEDMPRIELLDGKTYKDSAWLSTGQRCTTILPILLLESERPLLVDQPEDNLDNAFIFETVVKILKGARGSRQLIFVTHNPNIPVLGDADCVFVMQSDGQHSTLDRCGSVDELKDKIETLLEGGREAFLLRKERYGH